MMASRLDCPVFEVAIHPDLALAVRNEAQLFIEYLKGQEPEFEPGPSAHSIRLGTIRRAEQAACDARPPQTPKATGEI
jgi:hypothetical protein